MSSKVPSPSLPPVAEAQLTPVATQLRSAFGPAYAIPPDTQVCALRRRLDAVDSV